MILSAFSLEGKVAVVTGCDTGLGQGMASGLAQAGCDIVGINIVEPTETIKQVTALGRRCASRPPICERFMVFQHCWIAR
ncbi:hypothetical protein ACNKHT_18335 [Shigella flexneri]